jgi:hypothetical protein
MSQCCSDDVYSSCSYSENSDSYVQVRIRSGPQSDFKLGLTIGFSNLIG